MRRLAVCLVVALGLGLSPAAFGEPRETHEVLVNRPSGFWTSNRPAVGGAYRYRLLLIGCAVAIGMGWLTWRTVRAYKPTKRG